MNRNYIQLCALLAIVFFSRLPFLSNTYGAEEDSYGFVLSVWQTHETGVYEPSRLPGHPVHELFFQMMPYASPFFYNSFSALMSVLAVFFFYLILEKMAIKSKIWASIAFAFTPVFFISSTYTIDYVWALAFILASLYFILTQSYIIAGILLALAVGCRITSAAMLLPFIIYLSDGWQLKNNFIKYMKFILPFALVSLLCFLPVINVFGIRFFTYYDQFPYPSLSRLIYKATLGVFGTVGFLALLFYGTQLLLKFKNTVATKTVSEKKIIFLSFLTILIYTLSYLRLPQKSGYMIPIIPFVIILFSLLITEKKFKIFSFLILLSSFVFGINITDDKRGADYSSLAFKFHVSGQEIYFDALTGPIYADYTKRKQKDKFVKQVISRINNSESNCIVIAGWWYNQILVELQKSKLEKLKNNFVFYINEDQMYDLLYENELFYLPEQDVYNNLYSNINSTQQLAAPLIK